MTSSLTEDERRRWDHWAHVLRVKLDLAEKYKREADEIKARMREVLGVGEHDTGDYTIVIEGVQVLDPEFTTKLPPKLAPDLYKQVPDTKAIQKYYGKTYYVDGTPRVSVKPREMGQDL